MKENAKKNIRKKNLLQKNFWEISVQEAITDPTPPAARPAGISGKSPRKTGFVAISAAPGSRQLAV
jgi:hypothetical protein